MILLFSHSRTRNKFHSIISIPSSKDILGGREVDNLNMSALFNFHSFLTVVLVGICACTYVKMQFPARLEQRTG